MALAINSKSTIELTFMNVNAYDSGVTVTVDAGTMVSIKCAGLGQGSPTWAWEFTNFYVEITDPISTSTTTTSLTGYEGN